ncbi:hypothetical protein [Pseudomonas phage D6]|nr:hypothetical protein [Pseudomonas phage D6]
MNSDYNIILREGEKVRWMPLCDPEILEGTGITQKKWYEATVMNCDHPNGLGLQIRNDGGYITNVQHWSVGEFKGFSQVEILDVALAKTRLLKDLEERVESENNRHKAAMDMYQLAFADLENYNPNKV